MCCIDICTYGILIYQFHIRLFSQWNKMLSNTMCFTMIVNRCVGLTHVRMKYINGQIRRLSQWNKMLSNEICFAITYALV